MIVGVGVAVNDGLGVTVAAGVGVVVIIGVGVKVLEGVGVAVEVGVVVGVLPFVLLDTFMPQLVIKNREVIRTSRDKNAFFISR